MLVMDPMRNDARLNIVIPMAGRGRRFQDAGYQLPKPLIPVHGIPMIQVVINNLRPSCDHCFVFLCQREHARDFQLARLLRQAAPAAQVLLVDGVTEGAACTVLLAREIINTDQPLMIANCDQWIDASIDDYLGQFASSACDGFLMTMSSDLPKWSYVKRTSAGIVESVVEKRVVSSEATVGVYNFARGRDFVQAAEAMIRANERVGGEFYVAPTYTWLIRRGSMVGTYCIGTDQSGMHGLGTPEDLAHFLKLNLRDRIERESQRMARRAA
jgi:NDP-sugar pyrophosphorylase family protein